MEGQERRQTIIRLLSGSREPVSGSSLAKQLNVSRQVIVQDIALLRANGIDVMSTSKGYVIQDMSQCSRVFKVHHLDTEVEEELFLIVDYGGTVEDVFVYHRVYGTVRAKLNISSRQDVREYLQSMGTGNSSLLMNVTSGYHYHTVTAKNGAILDMIQQKLDERGFLAQLQEYEPVDFWKKE